MSTILTLGTIEIQNEKYERHNSYYKSKQLSASLPANISRSPNVGLILDVKFNEWLTSPHQISLPNGATDSPHQTNPFRIFDFEIF